VGFNYRSISSLGEENRAQRALSFVLYKHSARKWLFYMCGLEQPFVTASNLIRKSRSRTIINRPASPIYPTKDCVWAHSFVSAGVSPAPNWRRQMFWRDCICSVAHLNTLSQLHTFGLYSLMLEDDIELRKWKEPVVAYFKVPYCTSLCHNCRRPDQDSYSCLVGEVFKRRAGS
jgi:hypothetical protein